MRKVYVRPHYRNLPRRSKQRKSDSSFLRVVGFGLPILALVYILSIIPLQVYFIIAAGIATLLVCGLFLFGSIRIYSIQQRKRIEIENKEYQEYMRRIEVQKEWRGTAYQDQRQQIQTSFNEQNVAQGCATEKYRRQQEQKREQEKRTHLTTLGEVLTLRSDEFEELIGDLLRESGYTQVRRVGGSGDLAADLIATDSQGRKVIVQCKRYSPEKTVGTPDLQKFIGMLIVEHKADFGIFVTTSSFSQKAIEKAKEWQDVLQLVDGNLLVKWLQNASLPE
jgi:restriction system protein